MGLSQIFFLQVLLLIQFFILTLKIEWRNNTTIIYIIISTFDTPTHTS